MDIEEQGYHGWERRIASLLERFPRTRAWARDAYRRMRYLPYAFRRLPAYALHPAVRLSCAAQAASSGTTEQRFFGYYDKSPWSPDMQHFLLHRHRKDVLEVCVCDLENGRLRVLGTTATWNWQQGCQLLWRPASDGRSVLFNDLLNRQIGCRVLHLDGGEDRFVPWPIQSVHPDGHTALSLNYRRLHAHKPEYGYAVAADNFAPDMPLDRDGLWSFDLDTGASRLCVSLAWLAQHQPRADMARAAHKVNHALYAPSGARYVFVHRWTGSAGRFTRLYVAESDGTTPRLLMDTRMVSHYAWRDDRHLLVWGRTAEQGDHYYLLDVESGAWELVGAGHLDQLGDGHPGYSPDRRWIVTDTYPDRARRRHLLLFDVSAGRQVTVGSFLAPWRFDGLARCDLHPRWSPDGRKISIDSAHEGWRDTYILDVSTLLEA